MKRYLQIFVCFALFFTVLATFAQTEQHTVEFSINEDGYLPVWLVVGPFEQPIAGLGVIGDKPLINEQLIEPFEGKEESTTLLEDGKLRWKIQSIDEKGYIDFNTSMSWILPGKVLEKIWEGKEGYAATYLKSDKKQDVILLVGSNSRMKVYLNHELVYSFDKERSATVDDDTLKVHLKKGQNILLIRVSNSHNNYNTDWFGGPKWGWGFYLRLLNENYGQSKNVKIILPVEEKENTFNLIPTFFFKESDMGLKRQFDIIVNSHIPNALKGRLRISIGRRLYDFTFDNIPFGESRHKIFIPELQKEDLAKCELYLGSNKPITKSILLRPEKHYLLYFVMLSHMDIGYTNTQPIVKERHIKTLDDVLEMCENDSNFKWTIETTWLLEQYELSRPNEKFERLIDYIKNGKITLSPLYTNPYTGWISTEEMIHSLSKARDYSERYGIDFPAAIYNDLPGVSWILPQVLNEVGANFLVCGINELYRDYKFQIALPKVFLWEGSDGSRITTYITEAYNEGRAYGMEKSVTAMKYRMWNRINKLKSKGYPYDIILINSAFGDNTGIPREQYIMAKEWNENYSYPRIIVSNIGEFATKFANSYSKDLPILKGDWTSDWDILYQSDPDLISQHRKIQHQLTSAEKLSTISWILNPKQLPMSESIETAYKSLLQYSGHGSGLEAGFGSPEENAITTAFRRSYVDNAFLLTEEILERGIYRLSIPYESLESMGIMVFNSLSWKRDAVISLSFPEIINQKYQVINLVPNETIPSYQKNHNLTFIARNLPPIGYKKFQLIPVNQTKQKQCDLLIESNSIENVYYRLDFDSTRGVITGITDKKSGYKFVNISSPFAFGEPVVARGLIDKPFESFNEAETDVNIVDERPLRLILEIERKEHPFTKSKFVLWNNLNRIDASYFFNFELLKQTEILEQYGIAFPIKMNSQNVALEIIGGFISPEERLPGIGHNAFSIRRSGAFYNEKRCVSWASADCRTVDIREFGEEKVLIANVVNNFPESWNRNQKNSGILNFRFSFTSQEGRFDPGFTSRFGWDFCTEPVNRVSWYNTLEPERSFVKIDNNNIILVTMAALGNGKDIFLHFLNTNPYRSEQATVKSEYFKNSSAYQIDFLGNREKVIAVRNGSFSIELKPNQIGVVAVEMRLY
jgi:hypothetical protein